MSKFVIEVLEGERLTAGTKAKEDIVNFLVEEKFKKISLPVPEKKLSRLLFGKKYWKQTLKEVCDGDTIVYQYPAYSRILGDYFIKMTKKKKNINKIIVIHDLNSLRMYQDQPHNIEREVKFLNQFDKVICHNESMKKWLLENRCKTEILVLEIFDYMEKQPIKEISDSRDVIFAGNLAKSVFLSNLNGETSVNLYGINPKESYPSNINYNGAFTPEELVENMAGGFGLVWDGDSIDTCNGMTGNYMRYNNPHKTSLYLAIGIPVIIWKEAALASYIEKNKLGFAINSLSELDDKLASLSDEEYYEIKSNVDKIALKIRDGVFIKNAVKKAIGN